LLGSQLHASPTSWYAEKTIQVNSFQ